MNRQEFAPTYFYGIVLPIINCVSWVAVLILNTIASVGKLNNISPGIISDKNPTKFTPAGWAFSIWTLIFIAVSLFCIHNVISSRKQHNGSASGYPMARLHYLFLSVCVFMFVWLFFWHWEFYALSLLAMLGILGSLIAMYVRIGINYAEPGPQSYGTPREDYFLTIEDFWLLQVPFSLFLGWISVATIANFSIVISRDSPDFGWTAAGWSSIMQIVALILAMAMSITRKDPVYPSVIAWALFAIASKQRDDASVRATALICAVLAVACAIGALVFSLYKLYKRRNFRNVEDF